ncbi:MAG TPA: hypothetical protein VHO69_05085 [Phototrophicaceae bacterium]|nr:hypothetical protein [Phototrophicaceae bacterium]
MILLVNIFGLAIVSAQLLSPEGQALRDLLSGPNCQHVCFDGLEPAVTTLDEVKTYFAERGINYTVYEGIGNLPEKDSIHYWKPVGVPFIDSAETISSDIGYANGIVMRLEVLIKIPISAVLEVYGNPVDVQYDDGGRYYLIYPDLGLTFQANAPDLDNTVAVLISTPDLIKEVFLNPPLHPSLQECPEPVQLCNISTATPTPIPVYQKSVVNPVGYQPIVTAKVNGTVNAAVWNPTGTVLAVASADGVTVFNQTLELLTHIYSDVAIEAVSWSPNGEQLAVTNNAAIEIWSWDGQSRQLTLVRTLDAPTHQIMVLWKPSGEWIASLGLEIPQVMGGGTLALTTIYIWNTVTWQLERVIDHQHVIDSYSLPANLLEWNPDNSSQLIGIGCEGYMGAEDIVWETGLIGWVIDVNTGEQIRTIAFSGPLAYSVARQPDGNLIAIGKDAGVSLYDYSSGEFVDGIPTSFFVQNIAWSPDGRYIVGGGGVAEARTGEVVGYYDLPYISAVAWHPDGTSLVLANADGEIQLEDPALLPNWEPVTLSLTPTATAVK